MLQRFAWKTRRRAHGWCCFVLRVPGQLMLWEITHMQGFYVLLPKNMAENIMGRARESLI